MAQPDPDTASKSPARRRSSTILRVAFALIVVGTLPLDWAEGFSCGGGAPWRASGVHLWTHAEAGIYLTGIVLLLAPIGLGKLADGSRRVRWRVLLDLLAMLLAAAGTLLSAILPEIEFARHRLLAAGWTAVIAQGAIALDGATRLVLEARAFWLRRRGRQAKPLALPSPRAQTLLAFGMALSVLAVLWIAELVRHGPPTGPPRQAWISSAFDASDIEPDNLVVGDTAIFASSRWGGRIVRIDTQTGKAVWTFDGARASLLPDDEKGAVWAVVDKPLAPPARIVELDPLTGKPRRSVDCPSIMASLYQWYRRGDAVVTVSSSEVLRVDPTTCRSLWSAKSDAPLGEYGAQLGPRAAWIPSGKNGIRRFSLSDGAAMEAVPDPFVSFVLTAETAYVLRKSSLEARIATSPQQSRWVAPIPPPFQAERLVASESFVAVLATSGPPPNPKYRMLAYRVTDGSLAFSGNSEPKQYFGYLGLGAGQLAYYSSKDKAIILRDLARGRERLALQLTGHFVISPDATGTSPPVPGGNPIVRPPWLFVPDFGKLVALRID